MVDWRDIASKKRDEVLNAIPKEWVISDIRERMTKEGYTNSKQYIDTLVPPEETRITNYSVLELCAKISGGDLTSLEVCNAFCHRAALAHQLLNCCVEIFFDRALAKAKEQDAFFAKTGKTVGPFHGIPISLKDQLEIPGVDTTIGYVGYVGNKPTKQSLLASILEERGALFYVKTTVPMAMMAPETVSNLMGVTLNGVNLGFSSGGSSGGEGALIAAGGSAIGIGTDIGGSIRIPAAFQGLYALRPSHGRLSYMNVANSYVGQEVVPSVIGPLGGSLGDVEFFAKTVVESEAWDFDPKLVPIPWRDMSHLKQEKLRFAVMWWDKQVMVHPPVTRALQNIVEPLKAAGHEIIDFDFRHHNDVLELASDIFSADYAKEIQDVCNLSGEPFVDAVKPLVGYDPNVTPISVSDWWKMGERKSRLREKFFQYWQDTANQFSDGKVVDAIICPVWPSLGFKKDEGEYAAINYSVPFNVLDCASEVLPVTLSDKDLDLPDNDYEAVDDFDQKIHDYYDPIKFDSMPVCVQVVCKRLEEEKALMISRIIDDLL